MAIKSQEKISEKIPDKFLKIEIYTPVKAIRRKCFDCTGGHWLEIKKCPNVACALFPYRFGKRPTADIEKEIDNASRIALSEKKPPLGRGVF